MTKIRTQIQLEPAEYRRVKDFATRHGISSSAAIRMLLRQALGMSEDKRDELKENFIAIAGKGHDFEGRTDVARRHDHYIYEKS